VARGAIGCPRWLAVLMVEVRLSQIRQYYYERPWGLGTMILLVYLVGNCRPGPIADN
jgi:hypothetical protein